MDVKVGDIVARKSYNKDTLFRVSQIIKRNGKDDIALLKGMCMRVLADAPLSDLVKISEKEQKEYYGNYQVKVDKCVEKISILRENRRAEKCFFCNAFRSKNGDKVFEKPGKVLHLDGDEDYLKRCLEAYSNMKLDAVGKFIKESEQPSAVYSLLQEHSPDILVLTGHDSMAKGAVDLLDARNYRNSKYFIDAVKQARRYNPSLDDLVIFAGACQSNYEELLKAGANFASAPDRVLIHMMDPVLVAEKIAFTSIDTVVPMRDVITSTITGIKGIGGFETRGKYREGLPKSFYEE